MQPVSIVREIKPWSKVYPELLLWIQVFQKGKKCVLFPATWIKAPQNSSFPWLRLALPKRKKNHSALCRAKTHTWVFPQLPTVWCPLLPEHPHLGCNETLYGSNSLSSHTLYNRLCCPYRLSLHLTAAIGLIYALISSFPGSVPLPDNFSSIVTTLSDT